jgi:hypothetical protein
MPSEGRGILSPVRLPVPPLQQMYGSFELTANSKFAHCNSFCNGSLAGHFTLFSFAPLPLLCVLFEAFRL